MSEDTETQEKVIAWFKKSSREGKTKFYLKDVVKALADECDKRSVRKAIDDCILDGSLMYFSTGSTTMLVLTENFPKSVT